MTATRAEAEDVGVTFWTRDGAAEPRPPHPPHHRRERSGVQQPPSLDAPRGVRRTSHGARRARCSARRLARALRPAGRLPAPSAVAALCLRQFRPAEHCLTLPRGEKEERKLPALSFHT